MTRSALLPLLCALALSGCGQADEDPAPGAVTADEARRLDAAAASIDINASQPDNQSEETP